MKRSIQLCTVRLFVVLLLITHVPNGYAQPSYALTDFTTHQIGDTVPVFSQKGQGSNLMIFATPSECMTCDLSLDAFAFLQTRHHVVMTMFIVGETQEFADTMARRNQWAFHVIGDPLGVYQRAYSVKAQPMFFLTDSRGLILAMDKVAGRIVPTSQVDSLLYRSDTQTKTDTGSARSAGILREFKRIHIRTHDGTAVTFGAEQAVCSFQKRNAFAVLDCKFGTLYIVDSTGEVSDTIMIKRKGRGSFSPLDMAWWNQDSILLISGENPMVDYGPVIYKEDVTRHTLTKLPFNTTHLPSKYRASKAISSPITQRTFLTLKPAFPFVPFSQDTPTIMAVDTGGRFIASFGTPDSILSRYGMSIAADGYCGFDATGRLYESQRPTRSLNIYDRQFHLVRHLNVAFGPSWRDFKENFPPKPNMQYWMHVNSTASLTIGLFPSSDGEEISLCYLNVTYARGETDPLSKFAKVACYVHRLRSTGANLDDQDILLPPDSQPFNIEKEHFGLKEYKNNHLDLVWYDLNKPLSTSLR